MSFETPHADAYVVAAGGQVSCELGDEILVLNPSTGVYYSLGGTEARIWKALQVPRTVSEIRDLLLSEYDVDARQCETDTRALIEQLLAEGLVEARKA